MQSSRGPARDLLPGLSIFGTVCVAFGVTFALRGNTRFVNVPLHSALETTGAIIALATAVFILIRQNTAPSTRAAFGSALISMGMLDLVHAGTGLGPVFFWSRALPTLIGGILIALVWLPNDFLPRHTPAIAAALTVPLCLALMLVKTWPAMFYANGEYTAAAKLINGAGGVGFLIAAVFFFREFGRSRNVESLLFANQATLFGLAAALFTFSRMWDGVWWSFHVLRMLAYLFVLVYAVDLYRRHQRGLRQRVESQLLQASQRLRLHAEISPIAMIEWDRAFRVVQWTPSAEQLFGWKAKDVVGKHPLEWPFVHPDDVTAVSEVIEMLMSGTSTVGLQNRNLRHDGSVVFCDWYNSVLRDEQGLPVSVLSFILDMTDRIRADAALRAAKDAAETANRVKDEFLATVSHELKTPMTALLGWLRMLQNGTVTADKQAYAMTQLSRSAIVQRRIIDDLLDTSRLLAGKLSLHVAPLDLVAVARSAAGAHAVEADQKKITLSIESAVARLSVNGDADRLAQVVTNLLSNALKFTPSGGSISLRLNDDAGLAVLRVIDNGVGIEPDFLPHVFDRFRQADSSNTRAHGGLGLGLAISKDLVDAHGGTISVQSNGMGQGAEFVVRLPTLITT